MMGKEFADGIRMDSHKLIYHVDRVNDWLKGRLIYPIFMDVSPTNACNHRCIFCGLDFAHGKPSYLDPVIFDKAVKDASARGLKSIMFAGEGEPLLHTGLKTMISRTKSRGVDCALATNGALMDELFLKASLRHLTWVRVSVDAGTASTYARIHTARKEDFTRVLGNIEKAVRIKKKNALKVTIGVQFLLLKENAAEAVKLASILSGMGVDYLAVKPYSKHPLSSNDAGTEINYSGMLFLEGKLNRFSKKGFNVIFRKNTMLKRSKAKSYERCLGLPFWAYISADGEVYPCHTFLGIKKMSFGNINELSFRKIWEGGKRAKVMKYLTTKMDAGKCREMCRLDEMNAYLWKLAHPHPHVNFI